MHHECTPKSQEINEEYYMEVLRRLPDVLRRKRPDMWVVKNFQLQDDDAPAHFTRVIKAFLAKNSMSVVRQAPYSLSLEPCDFWVFPKLKTTLKGRQFQSREDIIKN